MAKKLYRDRRDKKIAGVCSGIANYLNIDPTVVRVAWAILTLVYGAGLIGYIVAWFIIPEATY